MEKKNYEMELLNSEEALMALGGACDKPYIIGCDKHQVFITCARNEVHCGGTVTWTCTEQQLSIGGCAPQQLVIVKDGGYQVVYDPLTGTWKEWMQEYYEYL